ncbi:hypothetical protein COC42_04740 [Sphingomonas spermidinifaciens]|uniref:SPOR domain-containing protein n=1 Tax=Sphingomonas spermidinifaciens TaxID=1141889 RepID=A0A2A4B6H3_9SPHN|nr:SPOR domain-containing protein [Sphingomonas spermidinifaciens]PCD03667.1 hypothetical protein COC42_04740 [Sphingomonas spermidinifaciens]
MTRHTALWLGGAALLVLVTPAAVAQQALPAAPGYVPQPTPTADKLAAAMRTLGRAPQDVEALIAAGEASALLDDAPAALQFLARAEKVRPTDPRIAAARGRALVRMGRPGEALRRFADAERGGLSPAGYADDRGLAYDLVGDQAHAQAEYRRALATGDEAEVRRRLAISLAISGDQPGAEQVLDPLLRQQDRASWRTRALVMALAGDTAGAGRVTATMMPGFATAYQPLFRRLSEIRDPADRAFAAHLGEFTRTPARLADAGLAPPAPALPQRAPVQVASLSPAVPTTTPAQGVGAAATRDESAADTRARARQRRAAERRAEREALNAERYGRRPSRVQTAAASRPAPPGTTRSAPAATTGTTSPVGGSLPASSSVAAAAPGRSSLTSAASGSAASATAATSAAAASAATGAPISSLRAPGGGAAQSGSPAASLATGPGAVGAGGTSLAAPAFGTGGSPASTVTAAGVASVAPSPPVTGAERPAGVAMVTPATPPAESTVAASVAGPTSSVGVAAVEGRGTSSVAAGETAASVGTLPLAGASVPPRAPEPSTGATAPALTASAATAPGFSTGAAERPRPVAPTRRIGGEDDVLAMIVRNIAVPAAELGVTAPPPVEPAPAPVAAKPAPAPAPKPEPKKPPTPIAVARAELRKPEVKPADAKKAAAKKDEGKKPEPKKPEPKKPAEPARWWVQVAGGANVADLPKAWNALVAKSPALKGKQAWTTPLRFTNRLLTGPFASGSEAQALVNTLGKGGLSAFTFQSEAGQKVSRLPAK